MPDSRNPLPDTTGLTSDEAMRRLQNAGATVFLEHCASKKGVAGADSLRVVRQRVQIEPQTGMIHVELLVSAFQTKPTAE